MKKLITLLLIIGLTVLAAFFTPILMKDPGYFLIRFAGYEIEMRFIVAFGLFILAVFLFWLVVFFLRLPKKTMQSLTSNRSRKSFAKGLLALSEGKWKQAEKLLINSAKNSPTPELSYMAAARAAVAQNKIQQAFVYLDEAENSTDNPLTVDLTRSELWVKTGSFEKASKLLNRILKSYPNNPRALYLLTQSTQNSGQWQRLREILPKIQRLEIMPAEKAILLTQKTIIEQLNQAESTEELQAIWKDLSKKQRLEHDYVFAFAKSGLLLGLNDEVGKLIETNQNKNFSDDLLTIWSQLNIDTNHKIKLAEKWLKKNQASSNLLQILGGLCLENKLWGKAQTYLQQSLTLDPTAQTYKLMARYFDAVGESENALEAYRQAEGTSTQLVLIEEIKDNVDS